VEREDGSLGLSYVLLDDSLAALAGGQSALELPGADAMALAAGWRVGCGAAAMLGFAAVNALSRHLFDRAGFVPPVAPDSIGGLDPQPGEHFGMVGFFRPLVTQVTARGARLTVLKLRPDLAGEHPGFTVTLNPHDLQDCDKVLSTSTVLLNHTLDAVLANCRRARRIALIGPGAGCLPEVLFEAGVTTVGGTWITDPAGFKQALHQGLPGAAWPASSRWTPPIGHDCRSEGRPRRGQRRAQRGAKPCLASTSWPPGESTKSTKCCAAGGAPFSTVNP